VPELDPRAAPIEVGEGGEELGERVALPAEEIGENVGQLACGRHDRTIARVSLTRSLVMRSVGADAS
jgi:hypothetical protein